MCTREPMHHAGMMYIERGGRGGGRHLHLAQQSPVSVAVTCPMNVLEPSEPSTRPASDGASLSLGYFADSSSMQQLYRSSTGSLLRNGTASQY